MRNINITSINSELLRTFHIVARTGNVTQAAETIGRTQSAVSLQIKKLENILDTQLFKRRARGVALTEQGRKLLPSAQKVITELEHVGALFSTPLSGRVRVGIPDDYNETILELALGNFAAKHKDVEVFVRSGCTAGFPEAIENDELDLAIFSAGPIEQDSAFFSEPTVWAASKNFSLDKKLPVPLALFDRDCWWRDVPTNALDDAGRQWKIAYLSANFNSVKAAISAGLGVGILAKSALGDSMKILTKRNGFPPLPRSSLQLLKQKKAANHIVPEMENAILAAVSNNSRDL